MGTVSSDVLVQAMECVHRNSSEDLLKLLDRLMTEGQSPSHFAKQLVRFLRNAVVAKIAGGESPLLQISSDEKKKIASIAALFSEEDLTRFLNIVLRTHDELGYRQEQRFHLELGMLKMVHAHRLLPLEELLSQANAGGTGAPTRSAPPSVISGSPRAVEPRVSALSSLRPQPSQPFSSPAAASPARVVSPFEADRLRKIRSSEPEGSVAASISESGAEVQTRGNLAMATVSATATAVALAEAPEEPAPDAVPTDVRLEDLRSALVGVLEAHSQDTAADLLARGEWKFEANQIQVRLPLSDKVIDLSLTADARRLLTQEASRLCGHPIKLTITGGGVAQIPVERSVNGNGNGNGAGGARQRAAEDPIVQRMQEKFGAEVRTVVDLRKK